MWTELFQKHLAGSVLLKKKEGEKKKDIHGEEYTEYETIVVSQEKCQITGDLDTPEEANAIQKLVPFGDFRAEYDFFLGTEKVTDKLEKILNTIYLRLSPPLTTGVRCWETNSKGEILFNAGHFIFDGESPLPDFKLLETEQKPRPKTEKNEPITLSLGHISRDPQDGSLGVSLADGRPSGAGGGGGVIVNVASTISDLPTPPFMAIARIVQLFVKDKALP